ncbi:MAG: alpha/beta hydrolase [Planctomycetota bacterium]
MSDREPLGAVEIETGAEAAASVIWLHGLGADGHDFEPIVPALELPRELPVRFVFPHAPKIPVTINGGLIMRAWYDITDVEIDRRVDEGGIRRSAALVEDLIAVEKERGFDSRQILLAGFSQGGAVALHVGLRHAEPLAGILALSTYLPLEETLEEEATAANRGIPILHCHGAWDPVVPLHLGERSARLLGERGYALEWKTYPTQHSVHPQEVEEIGAWLRRTLGAAEKGTP